MLCVRPSTQAFVYVKGVAAQSATSQPYDTSQSRLFIQTTWRSDAFDVVLTDVRNSWSGFGQAAPTNHTLSPGDWLAAAKDALCSKQPSRQYTYQYSIRPDGKLSLTVRFLWAAGQRISVQLELDPVPDHVTTLTNIMALMADSYGTLQSSVQELNKSHTALQAKLQQVQEERKRAIESSTAREKELYISFSLLLNKKKEMIRDLQDAVDRANNDNRNLRDNVDGKLVQAALSMHDGHLDTDREYDRSSADQEASGIDDELQPAGEAQGETHSPTRTAGQQQQKDHQAGGTVSEMGVNMQGLNLNDVSTRTPTSQQQQLQPQAKSANTTGFRSIVQELSGGGEMQQLQSGKDVEMKDALRAADSASKQAAAAQLSLHTRQQNFDISSQDIQHLESAAAVALAHVPCAPGGTLEETFPDYGPPPSQFIIYRPETQHQRRVQAQPSHPAAHAPDPQGQQDPALPAVDIMDQETVPIEEARLDVLRQRLQGEVLTVPAQAGALPAGVAGRQQLPLPRQPGQAEANNDMLHGRGIVQPVPAVNAMGDDQDDDELDLGL